MADIFSHAHSSLCIPIAYFLCGSKVFHNKGNMCVCFWTIIFLLKECWTVACYLLITKDTTFFFCHYAAFTFHADSRSLDDDHFKKNPEDNKQLAMFFSVHRDMFGPIRFAFKKRRSHHYKRDMAG